MTPSGRHPPSSWVASRVTGRDATTFLGPFPRGGNSHGSAKKVFGITSRRGNTGSSDIRCQCPRCVLIQERSHLQSDGRRAGHASPQYPTAKKWGSRPRPYWSFLTIYFQVRDACFRGHFDILCRQPSNLGHTANPKKGPRRPPRPATNRSPSAGEDDAASRPLCHAPRAFPSERKGPFRGSVKQRALQTAPKRPHLRRPSSAENRAGAPATRQDATATLAGCT